MSFRIENISLKPDFYTGKGQFSWDLTGQHSGDVIFSIYVSKTNLDGDQIKVGEVTNQTFLETDVPLLRNYGTIFYYYITGEDSLNTSKSDIKANNINREPNKSYHRAQKKMIRDEWKLARIYNGIEIRILRRKEIGEDCIECQDPVTKERIISDCHNCFNTGKVGGYCSPFNSWGRILAEQNNESHSQLGVEEIIKSNWRIPGFPQVSMGDLIFEKDNGNIWHIDGKGVGKIASNEVDSQILQCSLLSHNSIEYKMEIL